MAHMRLCITPRLLLRGLIACFGLLLALHLLMFVAKFGFGHNSVFGTVPMFYFGKERNIPTAYTFILFVLASSVCILAAKIEQKGASRWTFLGIVFLFLGIDEIFSIHEKFNEPTRELLSTSGFFYYAWIIPYFVLVAVLCLILFGWLRALPRDLRTGMLISAFIYISGVFLMEGIGAWYWYHDGVPGRNDFIYFFIVTIEESLEILGLTIFIYVVSKYLASSFDYLQIEFTERQ